MTKRDSQRSLLHDAWGLVWRHMENAIEKNSSYFADKNRNDINNEMECDSFYATIHPIVSFYIMLIAIIGLIGNCLSMLTFMTTKLRKFSSSHYLTALAVADSGALMHMVALNQDLQRSSPIMCPLTHYLGCVFSSLSVWCIVSFTFERFIAVRYPLKTLRWCTVRRARATLIFLTLFAGVYNLNILAFFRLPPFYENTTYSRCDVRQEYFEIAYIISVIDSILTSIIPLILIFVCNLMIVAKILRFEEASPRSRSPSTRTTSNSVRSMTSESDNSNQHGHRRCVEDRKITCVLLAISFVYVLLDFPDLVIRLTILFRGLFKMENWKTLSASEQCWLSVARGLTAALYGANFAVNFFLYCLVGMNFRKNLLKLIRRVFSCDRNRSTVV